ncbi:MAG: HEAT repeat domain-containing protein [Planctomycetaceae bacterium]|nr:HEAT repeat domain-containing protein [Planctomycetaceae bacterium]
MIRLKGENGRNSGPETKKELLEQLLEEYANSPDPLVRQEVVTASGKIFASSSGDERSDLNLSKGFDLVKYAAMRDDDPFVRREACRIIGSWQNSESAVVLRYVARNDQDKDVQLKAAQSLAVFNDKDTIETLGGLLDHRQPALRYQAMQSLKSCTKQDYGNDVHRWKQYLAGDIPDPVHVPSLAERFRIGQLPMIY